MAARLPSGTRLAHGPPADGLHHLAGHYPVCLGSEDVVLPVAEPLLTVSPLADGVNDIRIERLHHDAIAVGGWMDAVGLV